MISGGEEFSSIIKDRITINTLFHFFCKAKKDIYYFKILNSNSVYLTINLVFVEKISKGFLQIDNSIGFH